MHYIVYYILRVKTKVSNGTGLAANAFAAYVIMFGIAHTVYTFPVGFCMVYLAH